MKRLIVIIMVGAQRRGGQEAHLRLLLQGLGQSIRPRQAHQVSISCKEFLYPTSSGDIERVSFLNIRGVIIFDLLYFY